MINYCSESIINPDYLFVSDRLLFLINDYSRQIIIHDQLLFLIEYCSGSIIGPDQLLFLTSNYFPDC